MKKLIFILLILKKYLKKWPQIFRGGRLHNRVQKFMGTNDPKRHEKVVADAEDWKRHKRVSNWIWFIGHHEYYWLTGWIQLNMLQVILKFRKGCRNFRWASAASSVKSVLEIKRKTTDLTLNKNSRKIYTNSLITTISKRIIASSRRSTNMTAAHIFVLPII